MNPSKICQNCGRISIKASGYKYGYCVTKNECIKLERRARLEDPEEREKKQKEDEEKQRLGPHTDYSKGMSEQQYDHLQAVKNMLPDEYEQYLQTNGHLKLH